VESLGARFKQERERKGMTLDDVALSTKIGTRMLQAIEEDQFNRLPGGIFNKGFVRSYARHLGLDEEQAVADYLSSTGGPPSDKDPEVLVAAIAARAEETREARRRTTPLPWGKLAILLLIVAFGFALWNARGARNHQAAPQPSGRPINTAIPVEGLDRSPLVEAAIKASSVSGVPNSVQFAAKTSPASDPSGQPPAAKPGTFSLRVLARAVCWITISADGKEVAHELLPSGAQKLVDAQQVIMVKAGNVGGLDLWFNGQKLPSQGDSDKVKSLTFLPDGLQPVARAQLRPSLDQSQP
jgi:cytoskeleton protein RodZ